jgi:hypothetical protein
MGLGMSLKFYLILIKKAKVMNKQEWAKKKPCVIEIMINILLLLVIPGDTFISISPIY